MNSNVQFLERKDFSKSLLLFIFFSLLTSISVFAQTKQEKQLRLTAIKALNEGNYAEAESIYTRLLKSEPNNPDYNYEMGIAIFEQGTTKANALPYFKNALNHLVQDTLPEMLLYTAKTEQFMGNYNQASFLYTEFLQLTERNNIDPKDYEFDVEHAIEMCENAKNLTEKENHIIKVENLGPKVNSEYQDYAPVVTADERRILFTSRRPSSIGGNLASDFKYFEDVYYANNRKGRWGYASNKDSTNKFINNKINTEYHDATISFAKNENQLYIYRNLNLLNSSKIDGVWGEPIPIKNKTLKTGGYEPSIFISEDEQKVFLVSDIESGYGGRDIYYASKNADNTWSELKNLGDIINTKYDEDAPFLASDGKTLYFASKGHNSMGDYDIFKSIMDENGNFSKPENLGAPINTPGHDRYFITINNQNIAYYASDRPGGYGQTDIYRVIFEPKPLLAADLRGIIYQEPSKKPLSATIKLFDPISDKLLYSTTSDQSNGYYYIKLKPNETYKYLIETEDYQPITGKFGVPNQTENYDLFQEINFKDLRDSAGFKYAQLATIYNSFDNIDNRVEDKYPDFDFTQVDDNELDRLRQTIVAETDPLTNERITEIVDVRGLNGHLAFQETLGVSQNNNLSKQEQYENYINVGQQLLAENKLIEAQARFITARELMSADSYSNMQIEKINDLIATNLDQENVLAYLNPIETNNTIEEEVIEEEVIEEEEEEEVIEEIADASSNGDENDNGLKSAINEIKNATEDLAKNTIITDAEEGDKSPKIQEDYKFKNIYFDFDNQKLSDSSIAELNRIVEYLNSNPAAELMIEGHTDSKGNENYNLALSERRAKQARSYLISKGISEARLSYQFFGESKPAAPNTNADGSDYPAGRSLNRRCEFSLVKNQLSYNLTLVF